MKRFVVAASYIRRCGLTFLICIVAAALLYVGGGTPVLGIEPAQIVGEIDYLILARWLAMMSVPILINGYYLSRCRQVEVLSRVRLGSAVPWRMIQSAGCVMNTVMYSFVLVLPLMFIYDPHTSLRAFLLIGLNNLLWMIAQMAMDELLHGKSIAGIIIAAVICFCYVYGEHMGGGALCLPTSWGMLCRAEGGAGIEWFALANIGGCVLCIAALCRIDRLQRRRT